MPEPTKYWYRGLPLPGVNQAETTGELKYWWQGLNLPVLNSIAGPPVPPVGSTALPTAIRLALIPAEDWQPSFRRRFNPPEVASVDIVPFPGHLGWRWDETDWQPSFHRQRRFNPPAVASTTIFTFVIT